MRFFFFFFLTVHGYPTIHPVINQMQDLNLMPKVANDVQI
jgi:hypothetical protein